MTTAYQAYKPQLRKEFLFRCAYCETREPELGGSQSFHIDHYRPKKKFPLLISAYNNLVYACRNCNTYKSDYWPQYHEKLIGKIILNPREGSLDAHIDKSNFVWQGKTSQGKWNIIKLRLSSATLSQRREDRTRIEKKILKLRDCLKELNFAFTNAQKENAWAESQELAKLIEDETKTIEAFERKIVGPTD
jgi:hypothetical protein